MKDALETKLTFMEKLKKIINDKFSLFALLQLLVSISLFATFIGLIADETVETFIYFHDLVISTEEELFGYTLLVDSKPIFYFFTFIFNILYSLYGLFVLFKYHNQRDTFKIMYRSIFYTSTILFLNNFALFFIFLLTPINSLDSFLCILYLVMTLQAAVGGRLVSNFTLFSSTLKNRKILSITSTTMFLGFCIFGLVEDISEGNLEGYVFFSLEIVNSIFVILATLYFNKNDSISFELEPKTKKKIKYIDLPLSLESIDDHMFSKNTKLTRAIIPSNIEKIGDSAFANALRLKEVVIPQSVKEIGYNAFFNCQSLCKITYEGTKSEFSSIVLKDNWIKKSKTYLVNCKDGVLTFVN